MGKRISETIGVLRHRTGFCDLATRITRATEAQAWAALKLPCPQCHKLGVTFEHYATTRAVNRALGWRG